MEGLRFFYVLHQFLSYFVMNDGQTKMIITMSRGDSMFEIPWCPMTHDQSSMIHNSGQRSIIAISNCPRQQPQQPTSSRGETKEILFCRRYQLSHYTLRPKQEGEFVSCVGKTPAHPAARLPGQDEDSTSTASSLGYPKKIGVQDGRLVNAQWLEDGARDIKVTIHVQIVD